MAHEHIVIRGAREHNLKDVTVSLPRDRLVVITGLSGSGKSSLAFDTLYAEGQRRYVESLSAYARQFLGQMDKPDVDSIEGLSPAISIDQKTTARNPRSTVGTVTEIYDYLRLLYARVGHPHCPKCGREITGQTAEQIVEQVLALPEGTRFTVDSPVVRTRKGEYRDLFEQLRGDGYTRVKVDGQQLHARGADRPRQAGAALDLGGGRPAGDEARAAHAPDRLGRDGPAAGRGARRDRDRRRRHDDVLREVRLPRRRHLAARARAAHLLVQLAPRRLPALHRARDAARDRPRPGRARPQPLDRPGRAGALDGDQLELLHAGDPGHRRPLRGRPRHPVGRPAGGASQPVPAGHRRREAVRQLPQPDEPQAQLHARVRGHRAQPRAALPRDRLGLPEGADRGVHGAQAVPGCAMATGSRRRAWRSRSAA